ncbi:MAG: hypothetical protein QOG82_1544 [Actinomycetota bacterium]|nr:hypothetical protein [Actinomycetota bacterium]
MRLPINIDAGTALSWLRWQLREPPWRTWRHGRSKPAVSGTSGAAVFHRGRRWIGALPPGSPSGGTVHVDRRYPLASTDDDDVALAVTRIRLTMDGPGGNVDEVAGHRLHHLLAA